MVRLNHNVKIGDSVNIGSHLSWQVAEARISGNYKVSGMEAHYAILKRDGDNYIVAIDLDTLSYLAGTDVDNPPPYQAINPKDFQPSIDEEYDTDYLSECRDVLGFHYCGYRGHYRAIEMELINCPWCYIKLPW